MSSSLNGTGVTFSDSTTVATGHQVCKAWVYFSGSTPTISASYNISSVTRSATGIYQVNLTNAQSTNNYCVVSGGGKTTNDSSTTGNSNSAYPYGFATGYFGVVVVSCTNGTYSDSPVICQALFS